MTKPRASTIQERFGFQDGDMRTQGHDEIMLWLDGEVEGIVAKIVGHTGEWDQLAVMRHQTQMKKAVLEAIEVKKADLAAWLVEPVRPGRYEYEKNRNVEWQKMIARWEAWSPPEAPAFPPKMTVERTWEYAIKNGNYVIGFIDMAVWTEYDRLTVVMEREGGLRSDGKMPLRSLPWWELEERDGWLLFEVKRGIPSLGELIRQIRMYQEYMRGAYYIVCPDDRFAGALESQGIGFVHYPSGEIRGKARVG